MGGDDGIRVKQRAVVAAFASACSADGFAEDAVRLYAEQALDQHAVEALSLDPVADVEAHGWLLHASKLIAASAATPTTTPATSPADAGRRHPPRTSASASATAAPASARH